LQQTVGYADLALYQAKAACRNCVRTVTSADEKS
jgi:hypothetical protein